MLRRLVEVDKYIDGSRHEDKLLSRLGGVDSKLVRDLAPGLESLEDALQRQQQSRVQIGDTEGIALAGEGADE